METAISINKKSNTVYGIIWDIAVAVDKMPNRNAIWNSLFGDNDLHTVVSILEAQIESEGHATSEVYYARRAGNSHGDILTTQKARGVRFSTTKLLEFADRAGLNLSTKITN